VIKSVNKVKYRGEPAVM